MRSRMWFMGLALISHATLAADASNVGEFHIGPRIGRGEIRVDAGKPISRAVVSRTVQEDTAALGGTLEYRAPFGLVIEAGHFTHGEPEWWDDDKLVMNETTASIGWQIDLGNGFSLIPRAGRSKWKLEDDDSWFHEDEVNPKIRGYQNFWELSAYKRVNSAMTLGVSHKENNYDFGRSRTTVFVMMFNLGSSE